jgi:hypothetical protein
MLPGSGRAMSRIALATVRRGHEVIHLYDQEIVRAHLTRDTAAAAPAVRGADAILVAAARAASVGLDAVVMHCNLQAPGVHSFGTALRAAPVRKRCEEVFVRGIELSKVLGWVSAAADAHRHLSVTLVDEAIAALLGCLARGGPEVGTEAASAGWGSDAEDSGPSSSPAAEHEGRLQSSVWSEDGPLCFYVGEAFSHVGVQTECEEPRMVREASQRDDPAGVDAAARLAAAGCLEAQDARLLVMMDVSLDGTEGRQPACHIVGAGSAVSGGDAAAGSGEQAVFAGVAAASQDVPLRRLHKGRGRSGPSRASLMPP